MSNEEKQKHIDAFRYWCETNEECGVITIPKFVCDNIIEILDNAPTVEETDNHENCVLTMFGECSYKETGCSDCKIIEKIGEALKNDRPNKRGDKNDL